MPPAAKIETVIKKADEWLKKEILTLIHRIERIIVPMNSLKHDPVLDRMEVLRADVKELKYLIDGPEKYMKMLCGSSMATEKDKFDAKNVECICRRIDWASLKEQLYSVIRDGNEAVAVHPEIVLEIDSLREAHQERFEKALRKECLRHMQSRIDRNRALMPGKWRKEPFATRVYEPLTEYAVTGNISREEASNLRDLLNTDLSGFLGQAYNYDDHGLTEEWMVTFQDKTTSGPSDDEVIRTQIESLLDIMVETVKDRVCNEMGVLEKDPVGLGPWLKEVPVWGIDAYTRRSIELAITDRVPQNHCYEKTLSHFIEKLLLPAINVQDPKQAHDMRNAVKSIIENPNTSPIQLELADALLEAVEECGIEAFRIHPKGTGVICTNPEGIAPHVFVSEYLGETYPAYRWCERLDIVKQAQAAYQLKPALPDFYNILLERPRQDQKGYGLMFVDASQKANMGSSCSHSCEPNCTSAVVARKGRLVIAMTTTRTVQYGEELTMDYHSYTTSEAEWRSSVCLCGMTHCRERFLTFSTQDDLQQVLQEKCGPLWIYASLLRACAKRPLSKEDTETLARHGMLSAALGVAPPLWIQKYVADNLRFLEYERKALPCALLRSKDGATESVYSSLFNVADQDARMIMEQRLQSLVCCVSIVQRIIRSQPNVEQQGEEPLVPLQAAGVIDVVWSRLQQVIELLDTFLIQPMRQNESKAALAPMEAKPTPSVTAESRSDELNQVAGEKIERSSQDDIYISVYNSMRNNDKNTVAARPNDRSPLIRAMEAHQQIKKLLDVDKKPAGLGQLKELCIQMRAILINIEDLATSTARVGQLADVLLLWAHTTNFSTRKELVSVTSEPIVVCARELGTNIPRIKIARCVASEAAKSSPDSVKLRSQGTAAPPTDSMKGRLLFEETAALATEDDAANSNLNGNEWSESGGNACIDSDGLNTSIESTESVISMENMSKPNTTEHAADVSIDKKVRPEHFISPDAPVYEGRTTYSPYFSFWTLMGWFNAGTDQPITEPDLFGCVELPSPAQSFGSTEHVHQLPQQDRSRGELQKGYGEKHRASLMKHLKGDVSQTMPWPAILKNSYNMRATIACSSIPIYGSPMLDNALGNVGAVSKVLVALEQSHPHIAKIVEEEERLKSKGNKKDSAQRRIQKERNSSDSMQLDNILPPELPTNWVQCEQCKKWRRVAWNVDVDALPEGWECKMNTWDLENANCDVPQDDYDPDTENTVGFQSFKAELAPEDFVIGKWFDLYCKFNHVYYEAQVKKLKYPRDDSKPVQVLFHFRGWSSRFDELVPFNSDRIEAHNLHTNPNAKDPREQEIWQGMHDVAAAYEKPAPKAKPTKSEKRSIESKKQQGKKRKRISGGDSEKKKSVHGTKKKSRNATTAKSLTVDQAFRDDFDVTDDEDEVNEKDPAVLTDYMDDFALTDDEAAPDDGLSGAQSITADDDAPSLVTGSRGAAVIETTSASENKTSPVAAAAF